MKFKPKLLHVYYAELVPNRKGGYSKDFVRKISEVSAFCIKSDSFHIGFRIKFLNYNLDIEFPSESMPDMLSLLHKDVRINGIVYHLSIFPPVFGYPEICVKL